MSHSTYDCTLEYGISNNNGSCLRVFMSKMHSRVVVVLGIVDTAHHTLVIPKEEDCKTSNAINGDEELAFLQAVDDIPPVDVVHFLRRPDPTLPLSIIH